MNNQPRWTAVQSKAKDAWRKKWMHKSIFLSFFSPLYEPKTDEEKWWTWLLNRLNSSSPEELQCLCACKWLLETSYAGPNEPILDSFITLFFFFWNSRFVTLDMLSCSIEWQCESKRFLLLFWPVCRKTAHLKWINKLKQATCSYLRASS